MKKLILGALLCVCFNMVLVAYPVYATGRLDFNLGEGDDIRYSEITAGGKTDIKGNEKIDIGENPSYIIRPKDDPLNFFIAFPPTVTGIEDGMVYCGERLVTVTDSIGIEEVTVNGIEVILNDGQFVLYPAYGEQRVIARNIAGLTREVTVTVYDEETYNINMLEQTWNGIEGWQEIGGKWYYFNTNGTIKTGWLFDTDGRWYYFGDDGSMVNGWVKTPISSKWYYMDREDGHMLTDCWLQDPFSDRWYYLDENGAMHTGWMWLWGTWYLFDENGAMCTGWNFVNGAWYYLENGACLFNTFTWDGFWVDENGRYIGR